MTAFTPRTKPSTAYVKPRDAAYLLMEDGAYLLNEDGSKFLLQESEYAKTAWTKRTPVT
jgi:hypothetical protein